jgi:GTPase SAR1 family protein
MSDINFAGVPCFSICVIGSTATGKTSIINRIVNNTFYSIYEPTTEITYYNTLLSLSEENTKTRRHVMLQLED